jgi:hypothetical protein
MLKLYKAELYAELERVERHRRNQQCQVTGGTSRQFKPLTEQIEALMRTLPPAQRERPWSMEDLVGRLQGRFRARPHAANVGEALRALGWTRVRDWTNEGGGRRLWLRR